jgi:hypothetical protein
MSGPIATWHADGSLTIEWPYGKPDSFEITTVLFEQMMFDRANERALTDDLANIIAEHLGFSDIDEVERLLARYRKARQR